MLKFLSLFIALIVLSAKQNSLDINMSSNLYSDSFKKQEMINEPEYGTLDEIIEKYGRSGEVKGHKGKLYKEKFFEEVSPGHYKEFNFKSILPPSKDGRLWKQSRLISFSDYRNV